MTKSNGGRSLADRQKADAKNANGVLGGMQGEDFNYGGAGSKSDMGKPASTGKVKKERTVPPAKQKPVRTSTDNVDWGTHVAGEMPSGMEETEDAGKKDGKSKRHAD